MTVFLLAFRNVLLQRKRYFLMFLAVFTGFSLIILIHSITFGAMETVKNKAARYFSGHISITGYKAGVPNLNAPELMTGLLDESFSHLKTISPRTVYYRSDASLFFNGETVNQRRLIGIDFKREMGELSQLDFQDGSIDALLNQSDSMGILISDVAAKLLGSRVGDDITLYMTTDSGQFNTATLIVRGIFRETSLFGYVAYIKREDLNILMQKSADFATDIAIYAEKGTDTDKMLLDIKELLGEYFTVLSPINKKADLVTRLSEQSDGSQVVAPLTLDIHLDQIKTIMDAIKIVTWVVQVLFMIIVMVGILNTYRVLVYERTKEIGTLRAMGMTRLEVRALFLFEAFFLDLAACLSGFLFYRIIVIILVRLDISKVPGAGLFTARGHLYPHLDLKSLALSSLLLLAAVLLAAWGPAGRASRLSPVDAMREDD